MKTAIILAWMATVTLSAAYIVYNVNMHLQPIIAALEAVR